MCLCAYWDGGDLQTDRSVLFWVRVNQVIFSVLVDFGRLDVWSNISNLGEFVLLGGFDLVWANSGR